jgi:hypothetical protein
VEVAAPVPKAETTFALAAGLGAEIVMLPAPAPTLTIPAPEMFKRFVNVPAELTVVFPSAVTECDAVCTLADSVIVELACPMPIPAPAESESAPLEPLRSETFASAFDEA